MNLVVILHLWLCKINKMMSHVSGLCILTDTDTGIAAPLYYYGGLITDHYLTSHNVNVPTDKLNT